MAVIRRTPQFPSPAADRRARAGLGLRGLTVSLTIVFVVTALSVRAADDDATDRYFQGLLDRGLVRIAEQEARQRLGDERLTPEDRVDWTIRLSRAFSRHAEFVVGEDRASLEHQAMELLDQLAKQSSLPRQAEVRFEQALLRQKQVDLSRMQFEASRDERLQPKLVGNLRDCIERWRGLQQELKESARGSGRTPEQTVAGGISLTEVRRLQADVDQSLAESLVNLAELLSDGADRTAALREADALLRKLADGWIGDLHTWEARLLRVRLHRAEEEYGPAIALVNSALQDQPADWLVDRFTAELARVRLAQQRPDLALQTLLDRGRAKGSLSEELMLLEVESLLKAWEVAKTGKDEATAAELLKRAEAWTRRMQGGYQAAAMQLVEQARETEKYGPAVAALVQGARGAYQSGDAARAADLYGRAAAAALSAKQDAAADEFDYTRASILVSTDKFAEAVTLLDALQQRSPAGALAESGALLRAYSLGKLFGAEPTRNRRETYVEALEQVRVRYAGTRSAAEATWMLASLEDSSNQSTRALELYREITADPTHGSDAQLRVAALYEQVLLRLPEDGQERREWEDRALGDLALFATGFPASPDQLTLGQAEILTRLSRLRLGRQTHDYAAALTTVEPVLAAAEWHAAGGGDSNETAAWWSQLAAAARQLKIVSLAGLGRIDESRQILDGVAADSRALLGLLQGLAVPAEALTPDQRQALGHLQLQAARRLGPQRSALDAPSQRVLDLAMAEAYAATGNAIDAAALYESLLKTDPRNRAWLKRSAELLAEGGNPESLAKGKQQWQRIEALSRSGDPEWLEARYRTAELSARLGDAAGARMLIANARVLHPDLGGGEWREKFATLERQLDR